MDSSRTRTLNNTNFKPSPPLRILVPSDQVGAIIGKQGSTVKNITTKNKARVDVHGKENSGLSEKTISIYGQPRNCSNALKEILDILKQENTSNNRGGLILKMLADDRYCGRLIGKEGKFIKKVIEDTDTKVLVSNMQDVMTIYPDRIISIKGEVDNQVKAQALISCKLNECIERDSSIGKVPGSPSLVMGQNGNYAEKRNYPPNGTAPNHPSLSQENCQIVVPNAIVGSIIGSGGSIIKQIMQDSSAKVTVEPKPDNEGSSQERVVLIQGTADACWKASYYIFEKVKGEGMVGSDDRLKTAISISKALVGRVIGKNGKNVREIQRMTGSIVKLPEVQDGEEVLIEVYGNFMATQGAHNRIRAFISQQEVPYNNNNNYREYN